MVKYCGECGHDLENDRYKDPEMCDDCIDDFYEVNLKTQEQKDKELALLKKQERAELVFCAVCGLIVIAVVFTALKIFQLIMG